MKPLTNEGATGMSLYRSVVLVLCAMMCGCLGPVLGPPAEIVNEGDGAQMVYVPPGKFLRGSEEGTDSERPCRMIEVDGFYIDKYEVTNEQYRRFIQATGRPEPKGYGFVGNRRVEDFCPWADARFNRPNQPVVCVSWEDAAAYAAWAGKRLPTEAEWEKAARGPSGFTFPWGNAPPYRHGLFAANFDPSTSLDNATAASDGFEFTAPIGQYESGKSPYGVYDMAGNVAEWCADFYDPNYYAHSPAHNPQGPSEGKYRVIRGGSWGSVEHDIRCTARAAGTPNFKHWYIGFRCVKDKPGKERRIAQSQGRSTHTEIMSSVSSTTTSKSIQLPVEKVSEKDGAPMVLIPAGVFMMGSIHGDNDEKPVRQIYLPAFYMDKYPVTNAQYKKFVQATGHPEPIGYGYKDGKFVEDFRPWQDPRFNHPRMPVVCVSWYDAVEYARWAGRRLPTEAEWEKAAKGLFGGEYPWGNTPPSPNKARYGLPMETGVPALVGSYPAGATSYGCLDMAGNVWQWCADWYSESAYQAEPHLSFAGPPTGEAKVLRGGSWANGPHLLRCSTRFCYPPGRRTFYVGFRCVMDVNND